MLAVVATSPVCVQPPSVAARPARVTATRRARLRSRGVLAVICFKSSPASIGDKAIGAAIIPRRLGTAGPAIDAVDVAQQIGLRIGRSSKPVIRTRQILLRDRPNHIWRHQ